MRTWAAPPASPDHADVGSRAHPRPGPARVLGLDVGTETIKVVELVQRGTGWHWQRRERRAHHKHPGPELLELVRSWGWDGVAGAAVTGAYQGMVNLLSVPVKRAQSLGARHLLGARPATVVSLGSRGFSVLELHGDGAEVFRQNSRCSQGTGNFLRQLLERLSLSVEEADAVAVGVEAPAVLSARCPVILKTDVTHLANRGEERAKIVAGCFDAIGENVQTFLKPGSSPSPVVLTGGVAQSRRVRQRFEEWLRQSGMTLELLPGDAGLYVEALGCALAAAAAGQAPPGLDALLSPPPPRRFELLPPLGAALGRVRRMPRAGLTVPVNGDRHRVILGLDIGSTGSKAVGIDTNSGAVLWQHYRPTLGNPVGAAQALVGAFLGESANSALPVVGVGVTGSGREIVGALLATCHGAQQVFILNEIAAHAAGAISYDARVDTIFEIGGQDAKYIRLEQGRVVDCAMNEACSAGTGSFLEEQGRKFAGVRAVEDLERAALAADGGVSLGQHCSVFMAEMIDQAVTAGVEQGAIIAGLYDSVIQNYLHRVKGNRPVGRVVFCQGMPFCSSALAAAVARQTGVEVVVPPHPGMVGALGIALLAREQQPGWNGEAPLELERFLAARVSGRDTFHCGSTRGCGGAGQHCRIERLCTVVEGREQRFTWGGACGLHDRAFQRRKLPEGAPDPFREREGLIEAIAERVGAPCGGRRIAVTDEFMLKTHFPFFARFLSELGWEVVTVGGGGPAELKRGIQLGNVPFCAPMQLFHGLAAALAETGADRVLIPRIRGLPMPRAGVVTLNCPVVQASADVVGWDLEREFGARLCSPAFDFGSEDFEGEPLREGCRQLASELGVEGRRVEEARRRATEEQRAFDRHCRELGESALAFCAREGVIPVVVLGRPYTIHHRVLNSNVPAILREQGALAIPADCLDVPQGLTDFEGIYWGHGRRVLGVAHRVRRSAGVYAVFCSNYSCGPDSFALHFFSDLMCGKPFLIVETDGHAGDAGTRTRVEAFLHCVRQDQRESEADARPVATLSLVPRAASFQGAKASEATLLVPWMGRSSAVVAACLRGTGFAAEALPMPDAEALQMGRRHTSGKECLPLSLTLGSLLKRLQPAPERDFAFLIPCSRGPCRLGMYQFFDELVLRRLGWQDRVHVIAPCDEDYFAGTPPGFSVLTLAALIAQDLLDAALLEVRPTERGAGLADATHGRHFEELLRLCEVALAGAGRWSAFREAWNGNLFGIGPLLARAAQDFAAIRGDDEVPTVLVVGEIYVRLDPFANDFVVEKLERQGIRARLSSLGEHLDYSASLVREYAGWERVERWISRSMQNRIHDQAYATMAGPLGWPARTTAQAVMSAAGEYLHLELEGEAVLTVGAPLVEWRHGRVDGAINLGPLECMPTKIAEAQLFHAARREGLPTLTLAFNGEPQDPTALDSFIYEVKERFRQRCDRHAVTELVRLPSEEPRASGASLPAASSATARPGEARGRADFPRAGAGHTRAPACPNELPS